MAIARLIDLVEPLEPIILELLEDEDHMVRTSASAALARSRSAASHRCFWASLDDRSEVVRRAARQSLLERGQTAPQDEPTASQR